MSREGVHQLVDCIIKDKRFRKRLVSDPERALSGFDLDPEERAAAFRLRESLSDVRSTGLFDASMLAQVTPTGEWI